MIALKQNITTSHPQIAKEWHPTKNGNLSPNDVSYGSQKRVWWLCDKGHEWEASIKHRCNGSHCPYCSGRLPIKGVTDLATTKPELVSEWHPTKNDPLTPEDVSNGSNKKVWWRCTLDHEWQAEIFSRAEGKGCPVCNGKQIQAGFNDLKSKFPDLAAQWHSTRNGDLTPDKVAPLSTKKVWWECTMGHEWEATVGNRVRGSGCPICAGRKTLPGYNDLATLNPRLALEWHPTKNGNITASQVTPGSAKKVWWQCAKGHEWCATVLSRSYLKSGCPICAGKKTQVGVNDLSSLHPIIAAQWHPTLNGELTPQKVKQHSNKKVWWKCDCGHEWEARIDARVRGNGCPICSGRIPLPGHNDLASLNPKLAAEWHPTKNGELTTSQVTICSAKKVWWQCAKGHEWCASIENRSAYGSGCPICSGRQILLGYNDLGTVLPKLAAQWHPTLNGDLTPQNVTRCSNKKVWWRCSEGHEWIDKIENRSRGKGCPICVEKENKKG